MTQVGPSFSGYFRFPGTEVPDRYRTYTPGTDEFDFDENRFKADLQARIEQELKSKHGVSFTPTIGIWEDTCRFSYQDSQSTLEQGYFVKEPSIGVDIRYKDSEARLANAVDRIAHRFLENKGIPLSTIEYDPDNCNAPVPPKTPKRDGKDEPGVSPALTHILSNGCLPSLRTTWR